MRFEKIRFRGPIYGSSGYATAARNFVLALNQYLPNQVLIESQEWVSGFDVHENREDYLKLKQMENQDCDPSKTLLLHWSIAPEFKGRDAYALAVGHTIFETSSLPQEYVKGCNRMDAIMVPTAFHVKSFQDAGVQVPLQAIPEGVNCERFHPQGPRLKNIPERFTFLWMAQLSYRKSFDLVLKAFLELFAQYDDVQLVLRTYLQNGADNDLDQVADLIKLFRQEEMKGLTKGHVYLLNNLAEAHMPALYRSSHVLLAPFRGEGWGLPIVESLASETPVIATAWGGPMAYLNQDIASLLDYQLQTIPENIPSLFLGPALEQARTEGHLLAEPDYQQLKYAMWDAYQNYFLYKAKAAQARQHLQASFSWQQAALKFVDWIKTL